MKSRFLYIISTAWLTYERKKVMVVVFSAIGSVYILIGTVLTAMEDTVIDPETGRKYTDSGPGLSFIVIGVTIIVLMLTWFNTISKRRALIEKGDYVPLNQWPPAQEVVAVEAEEPEDDIDIDDDPRWKPDPELQEQLAARWRHPDTLH